MKDIAVRAFSGLLYVLILLGSMYNKHALAAILFLFGLRCIYEFKKLIKLNSFLPYGIFVLLYILFGYLQLLIPSSKGLTEATQILHVIAVFVHLLLVKDLFSEKTIPLFNTKKYLLTTFYISSAFVFLILTTTNKFNAFNPTILLCSFILIWTNDTFAYLVGSRFGKQKLFPRISPKKTVEGFLGGLFFTCLVSFFISEKLTSFTFNQWLFLAIIISVFGTLGDLIESKFKRQAQVKDSGQLMPGHGGLLDRLDSIIFAAPFIYLFLKLSHYVS